MAWNFVIAWIVSAVISYALRPKPPEGPRAATLGDIDAPTAEEGREIPVVFGTVEIEGANIVWYGDFASKAVKKKGGKK